MGIKAPTKARFMSSVEYELVTRVIGNNLPNRRLIIITNGLGLGGAAFTIPTSLWKTIAATAALGVLGPFIGYASSYDNLGYLMNVGTTADLTTYDPKLLVHETMHVWQGYISLFSQSYVFNSATNQCLSGQAAYNFTPGQNWHSYNVEQQASIVEQWFVNGESTSDVLFPYVRDFVRKGKA
jgi:hypothetical protein